MKILCAPDPHCWYTGPKDEQERIREWRECISVIKAIARDQKVDFVVIPGDLFVSNRPSPAQVLAIVDWLNNSFSTPIVISGNHDVCAAGQPDFVQVLTATMGIDCYNKPHSFRADDTSFALVPFLKGIDDDRLLAITHAMVAQMPPAEHKILVAHYGTDISTYSSGEMALGKEPLYRMADLEALPVDLAILGHIHKPGILSNNPGELIKKPIILHTGALTRRDHGEAKDDRSFFIITLGEDLAIESFDLPARKFVTVNPINPDWEICRDAYVRFRWQSTEEQWKTADTKSWEQMAKDHGAFHITGFQPQIERIERTRAEGLTEQTSPEQGLMMWLANQNFHPDLRDDILAEFQEALEEVGV